MAKGAYGELWQFYRFTTLRQKNVQKKWPKLVTDPENGLLLLQKNGFERLCAINHSYRPFSAFITGYTVLARGDVLFWP